MKKIAPILVLCFLTLCCKEKTTYTTIIGKAQGTTFSIKFNNPENLELETPINTLLKEVDHSLSLWDSTSLISKINTNQKTKALDSYFIEMFTVSKEVYQLSEGLFDPTVKPLYDLWGFHKKNGLSTKPTKEELDQIKATIGFSKINLTANNTLNKENPNIKLDFNAIAQGYTVDLVCNYLDQNNITDYLVEIGGELKAKGLNSTKETWRIGIEKPNKTQNSLQTVIEVKNSAVATSGSYRKYIEIDGQKYSHTLNPITVSPSYNNLLSVTVVMPSATLADAYATWFMVLGKDKTINKAKEMNIDIFLIYEENNKLNTYASDGFKQLEIAM